MNPLPAYAQRLEQIMDRYVQEHRRLVETRGYVAGKDLRLTLISLPANTLRSHYLAIKLYDTTLLERPWWQNNIPGLNPDEAIQNQSKSFEIATKHGMFVLFLSRIEWVLRCMSFYLVAEYADGYRRPFKRVVSKLLKLTNLQNHEQVFDLALKLRNSIHNNGHFVSDDKKDASCHFKGKDYIFVHMNAIDFGTVDLILDLYNEFLSVSLDIVSSKPVAGYVGEFNLHGAA